MKAHVIRTIIILLIVSLLALLSTIARLSLRQRSHGGRLRRTSVLVNESPPKVPRGSGGGGVLQKSTPIDTGVIKTDSTDPEGSDSEGPALYSRTADVSSNHTWKQMGPAELRLGVVFVALQAYNGKFLAAVPVDHGQPTATRLHKTFRVAPTKYGGFSLQAHSLAFMSSNIDGGVTIDRLRSKSYESWNIDFHADGRATIMSHHGKFLRFDETVKRLVSATCTQPDRAWCRWRVLAPGCNTQGECWTFDTPHLPVPIADSDLLPIVLFTSPKDYSKTAPEFRANTEATFESWAKLPKTKTILYTTDNETMGLAARFNIRIETEFFIHPKFNEPTYAGLFTRTFELYKDHDVIVYTNGDVMYDRGLLETITHVYSVLPRIAKAPFKFLMVGQRINADLPLGFRFGESLDLQIQELAERGVLFQDNAEDYFVISRAMWESLHIPDFIVGGSAFDNWFVGGLNVQGHIVIDGTNTITAVHLEHGRAKESHKKPKSEFNVELALNNGGWGNAHTVQLPWFSHRDPRTGRMRLWKRKGRYLYE